MGFSGSLEKMEITAYTDSLFQDKAKAPVNPFLVYINPEKYSENFKICYNDVQAQGSSGGSPEFNKIATDSLQFELIFDGTGVVPSPVPGAEPDDGIAKQIGDFRKLVFSYNGLIHSPNYLKVVWGKLLFKARLQTLGLTYTLFKPDGTPLRAKAATKFLGFTDEVELAKKANKTSPDLTHLRTVVAGDTLPQMCFDIYKTSAFYLQVAEANELTDFRDLEVGSTIVFPPTSEISS